jgi:hypothetical protein
MFNKKTSGARKRIKFDPFFWNWLTWWFIILRITEKLSYQIIHRGEILYNVSYDEVSFCLSRCGGRRELSQKKRLFWSFINNLLCRLGPGIFGLLIYGTTNFVKKVNWEGGKTTRPFFLRKKGFLHKDHKDNNTTSNITWNWAWMSIIFLCILITWSLERRIPQTYVYMDW